MIEICAVVFNAVFRLSVKIISDHTKVMSQLFSVGFFFIEIVMKCRSLNLF